MSQKITTFITTQKPWGKEVLIDKNTKFAFKEIYMIKGARSSLQAHEKKLETMFIVSGIIELEIVDKHGNNSLEIFKKNEAYTISPRTKHRVKVLEDCRLFEVSTPELNDVIRYDDDFGRTSV